MTATVVSTSERDPTKFATAIRQLAEGRSNAGGTITLSTNTTQTVVTAPNCAASSWPLLFEGSAAAATERAAGTMYVSAVANGQFTITHSNTTTAGRMFFWAAFG